MHLVSKLARGTAAKQSGNLQAQPEDTGRQNYSVTINKFTGFHKLSSKLKPGHLFRSGFFVLAILLSLFLPLQAAERETLVLEVTPGKNLDIDWDHSKNYRLQLPTDLKGNWLLVIEQQGVNVVPTLTNTLGEQLIAVDIPIFTVGIERLAFNADEMSGARVDLPLIDKVTSPGGLEISLQPIDNPQLFILLRQLMAGSALLKDKDFNLPQDISCETVVDEFNQDPGRAAYCFKAARENYKPEYKDIIGPEELDYYLADSVRRQTQLSDAQRLYLPLTRQQNDLRVQALALHGLAWTVWRSGEHKVGEAFAIQAVSIYALWRQKNPKNQGIVYQQLTARNIGCLILHDQEYLERAELCYLDLLQQARSEGDQMTENYLVGNLGGIYYRRGDIVHAREQFNKSYDLFTRIGDTREQALALSNIGHTETRAGNLSVALGYYQRAELLANKAIISRADLYRQSQAGIYLGLGDYQRARLLYNELEQVAISKGQKRFLGIISRNLAHLVKQEGQFEDARKYYLQSLEIEKELGNHTWTANTLLNLAAMEIRLGGLEQAAKYIDEADVLMPDIETYSIRYMAEHVKGKYLLKKADLSGAVTHLTLALNAYQLAGYNYQQANVHMSMVDAYRGMNQLEQAEYHAKMAISIVDGMRPENISMDLRASFSSYQREAYEKLIDLYLSRWQQEKSESWSRKALVLSEHARAQTLREAAGRSQSTASLSNELQQQRRNINERLNALATIRLEAREKQSQELIGKLNLDYTKALVALESFDQQYLPGINNYQVKNELDIEKQLAKLPENSALLAIYLSVETGALWVLANGQLQTYIIPAEKELEPEVEKILTGLRRPGGHKDVKDELQHLGKVLDPRLPEGVNQIRVTADGVLNYLPFAALAITGSEDNYWLQRYNIVTTPYIGDLSAGDSNNSSEWQSLSILADPEYDKSSISQQHQSEIEMTYPDALGLYRLRGSAVEAKMIAKIARMNLPTGADIEIISGTHATRAEVLEGTVANADILHFATHGIFNNQGATLAGLALSVVDDQGKAQPWLLTSQELYQTPIASRLVVMSACDAGTGKLVAGEGLLGMVRAFMYAGVSDVVSSQWKVSDRAAVALMQNFYTGLLENKKPVSESLRQAQLNFVQSDRYSDPFYWAGFSDFHQ